MNGIIKAIAIAVGAAPEPAPLLPAIEAEKK